ncbi:MAG: subclass B3 metallo-beta-lactamase [Planctomycetes bacterium]|nr:subclass B3 metallo-beta-lactamase [Planctomycetota bacterium]
MLSGAVQADEPFPAHRVAGNTYYVGSKELASYLITTDAGHILINSSFEETVPLIRIAIESLGFKIGDVKILLASHAHSDHVAGHALMKQMTGAQVFVMQGDDSVIARGGEGQYLYTDSHWPACPVDRVLKDGEEVTLGGAKLTARRTPGHTRGCTTWTWREQDGDKALDVVVIGSPNVNPGYQLVNNRDYPEIATDFAKTFATLKSLPCDLFLGAHGNYYGMLDKYEAQKAQPKSNPFIDPAGYKRYVEQKEQAYLKTLAEQQSGNDPVKPAADNKPAPAANADAEAARKAAEEAELARKFAEWKAKQTPERQKWETVLEKNLGGFYLPLYQRDAIAGRTSAWDYVEDDPMLPRVLLIGDSISRGYTLPARKALAGVANVHRAPENCGPTANGLKKLNIWLGDARWDVVHFNFGIHDRNTKLADYEARLTELVEKLKQSGAKLIWASTTPCPAQTKDGPDLPQKIVERNQVAARVMKAQGVAIDDLYTFMLPHAEKTGKPDDVHFNGEGYDLLGGAVADSIKSALSNTKTTAWKKHTVHQGIHTNTAVAGDFSGDGLPDVISHSGGKARLFVAPDWREIILDETPGHNAIHSETFDVDGDGDLDYIGAQHMPGLVFWLEQPERPLESRWPLRVVDDQIIGIHGLLKGDVDGDGKIDLIANSAQPKEPFPSSAVWLAVPRDVRGAERWTRHVFANRDAPGLSHYFGLGDVNGDGRADIALAAKGGDKAEAVPEAQFAWWEAPPDRSQPWTKHLLADRQAGATNIQQADVNSDGRVDFIATRGHGRGVIWFEAPDWQIHDIHDTLKEPHSLAVADLDGDGDIDCATCAYGDRVCAWFENDGRGGFTTHVLDTAQAAYDLRAVDMDRDGDLDLLVAGQQSKNVVWYENPRR